jgi:V/A-type H+-transporting ATPase subunit K
MATKIIIVIALLLSIIIPFGSFLYGKKTKGSLKAAIGFNVLMFFGIIVISNVMMFTGHVSAATTATAAEAVTANWKYLGAALATGLSCIGGGIAVASAASAALGAISEDSSIMGKSLIFVALAEGIALYGLIISFMILS